METHGGNNARETDDKDSGLAERLLRIGKDCAAHLKEPFRSQDAGNMLYDENGLPKNC